MSDTQLLRDAIEAAGLQSVDGSGPIYNDARKDGTRRLKLAEAGYFPSLPLEVQWLINDYLEVLFGERLQSVYLVKNSTYDTSLIFGNWGAMRAPQELFSLCVVLRDY